MINKERRKIKRSNAAETHPRAVAHLENRQGGDNPKRAHIVTWRAQGRKVTTGAEGDFCLPFIGKTFDTNFC